MVIVVESGSTKSDWVVLSGEKEFRYETIGLNPYFHDAEAVEQAILENVQLCAHASKIERIFFYGAGCSSDYLNAIIEEGIQRVFLDAKISVDHDLTACAYATFTGKPAISCILGTGSNSCYYDGNSVSEVVPALGYILGDEGSGSYFGKRVLTDFLYKRLPKEINDKLVASGFTKDHIIDRVYREPHANVFLASLMPLITEFKHLDYVKNIAIEGFQAFVNNHVLCFPNAKDVEVHFVGSVSHFYQDELRLVCENTGIKIGNIIRRPIDGLVHYHTSHLINV